jgi:hypothetical protein
VAELSETKKAELFLKIRDRFQKTIEWESENREAALEDIAFRKGDQWPENVKKEREEEGRPALVFNRCEGFIDQVSGDARQNKIEIKITSDDSPLAPLYEAIVSQIQYKSKATIAYNTALDHAAGHGTGFIRIGSRYLKNSFDQECFIQRVTNPFTVYIDPRAKEQTKWDMRFAFVSILMAKEDFEEKYPNANGTQVPEGRGESYENWYGDDGRIAEYFERREVKKKIYLLKDNRVVESKEGLSPDDILDEREDTTYEIWRSLITGHEYLEEPQRLAGEFIPIVPVYGKELHEEGKIIYRGIIRHAKDSMIAYNFHRNASAEAVGLSPKAPWLATADQVENYEAIWQTANTKNHSYLPYNHKAGQPIPQRIPPSGVPSGAVNEAAMAAEDLKATTGIYDASLGARGNETSGKAILARKSQGDTATFAYHDNLSIAVEQCGRVLVSMIPEIYDGERQLKVKTDKGEQEIMINQRVPEDPMAGTPAGTINDVTQGTYEVKVTTGASYATERIEARDTLMQLVQVSPEVRSVAMDKVMETFDFRGADEIAARMKPADPQNPPPPNAQQQIEMATQEAEKAKAQGVIATAEAKIKEAEYNIAMIGVEKNND